MKKFICALLICFIPLILSAKDERLEITGSDACYLFDALTLEAEQIPQDIHGYSLFRKALSGLSCIHWVMTWQEYKAGCGCTFQVNMNESQKENIYLSLGIPEYQGEETYPLVYSKYVGDLLFIKSVYQEDHYDTYTFYDFPFLRADEE